jgi:tripartite-type tricarboxylate transporter receptor subunit TctC
MRRSFRCIVLAVTAAVSLAGSAWARLMPVDEQTLQIIVPAQGHSSTRDAVMQLVSIKLADKLQRKLQIMNLGGPAGAMGTEAAAKAPADGSTLLFAWGEILTLVPSLKGTAPAATQEFEPIILVGEAPNILVVNNDLPVQNLAEFTQYVRSHPGVVNFGSIGNGSYMHLAGLLYMNSTDTNMVHIPYSAAGLATSNLISGEIQSMFQLVPGALEAVRAGKLRALGVMSARRSPSLPDVPTMEEQGHPELESANWFALLAPKGTPPEIIASINAAVNDILDEPEVRARLIDLGVEPLGGSPAVLQERMATEQKKWQRIISGADMAIR